MAAMVARGSSSSSSSGSGMSSSPSVQEKGSRNKRKFRADPPLSDPNRLPSSLQNECPGYEFSAEKPQGTLGHDQYGVHELCHHNHEEPCSLKPDIRFSAYSGVSGSSMTREESEIEEFQDADWSDLTETQLEELVLSNLETIFKSALKKIVACGYSEEVATKAVLRSGLCYGCKDTVSNIVDNTLAFLSNGQEIDTPRDHFFEDLQQLEKYILAEMVCVLTEVRPFFSTGDAMWCLLICDMNISLACAMDGDPLSNFNGDVIQRGSSSVSTHPELKSEDNFSDDLPNPIKPNPLFPCPQSSQSETPLGIPNLPNPKKTLIPKAPSLKEENPISTSDNVGKSLDFTGECCQASSQSSSPEEKSGNGRKGHSISPKKESMLRQKSLHLEKNYRSYGSKGSLRTGKFSGLGGLILDKKMKSVSDSTSVNLKKATLKISKSVVVDASQADVNNNPSINAGLSTSSLFDLKSINALPTLPKANAPNSLPTSNSPSPLSTTDTPSMFPAPNTELSLSLQPQINTPSKPLNCNPEVPNYSYGGIPYDKTLGQWVPQDKKDEMILNLVPRVRELQNQLQEWTEWANQKVMQAARRLGKDKAELKNLRQEREEVARLKKEKQMLEENTMKKLSEMENALFKASGQVEKDNSSVHRLERENAELRKEMEAAKLRAAESAASCQEVSKREKKTQKKFQSWERQKTLFQEELVTEKRKLAQVQQDLELAKDFQDQLEAKRKQEEKAKDEMISQASSIRIEKEQIEASAKSKEDMIKLKAENDLHRYKDDIRKLEKEISQLRLKTDSSKIAALRRGINGSYASRLTDGKSFPSLKGTHTQNVSEMMPDFQDYSETGDVKRDRECVMCLSEEMSVVFLPCAHQVVCTKCNEIHEKQGMKECPSCRTHIQRRICVRYAPS